MSTKKAWNSIMKNLFNEFLNTWIVALAQLFVNYKNTDSILFPMYYNACNERGTYVLTINYYILRLSD